MGWSAPRVGLEDNHANTLSARTLWAVGWFFMGRSARGLRATKYEIFGAGVAKPQPATSRGVGEEEPGPTAWDGVRPALAAKIDNHAKSAIARVLRGRMACFPRGEARAGCAARDSESSIMLF